MYHKALLFEDHVIANKILLESNPANVKNLGRQVKNFTIPKWTKHSDNIVYNGCLLKFSQNIYLKKQLGIFYLEDSKLNIGFKVLVNLQ